MDPSSIKQRELALWALKMGYLPANGNSPAPKDFASATCTPDRRRLWAAVIKNTRDRRQIRYDQVAANKNSLESSKEKLENTRKLAETLENELERTLKRMRERVARIATIEQSIEELELKTIIFNRAASDNLIRAASYREMGDSIQLLNATLDIQSITPKLDWVQKVIDDVKTRHCDPDLRKDIHKHFAEDCVDRSGFWHTLIQRHEPLIEACAEGNEKSKNEYEAMRHMQPQLLSWPTFIHQQKEDSALSKAFTLLLRGQQLSFKAGIKDGLKDKVVEASATHLRRISKSDEVFGELPDKIELDKLKLESENSKKTCETLIAVIKELQGRYEKSYENEIVARGCFSVLAETLSGRMTLEADQWSLALQRRNALVEVHIQAVSSDFHPARRRIVVFPNGSCGCTVLFPVETEEYFTTLQLILKKLEAREGSEKHSGQARLLEIARNRTEGLTDDLQHIRRLLALCWEQPFGNMIPESCTANGLTYKEWRQQSSLWELSRQHIPHNFSHLSHSASTF